MDLPKLAPEVWLALLGAAAFVGLVQTARLAYRSFIVRWRLARSRARGAAGEVKAEALLARHGFEIVGRQVAGRYGLGVDGALLPVDLRADFVVASAGRTFVAEVKTGVFAPRLETAATRRQLLEYRVAFAVDGVLLVDADAGTVRCVEFPLPTPKKGASWLFWLALGAGLALSLRALATLAGADAGG